MKKFKQSIYNIIPSVYDIDQFGSYGNLGRPNRENTIREMLHPMFKTKMLLVSSSISNLFIWGRKHIKTYIVPILKEL